MLNGWKLTKPKQQQRQQHWINRYASEYFKRNTNNNNIKIMPKHFNMNGINKYIIEPCLIARNHCVRETNRYKLNNQRNSKSKTFLRCFIRSSKQYEFLRLNVKFHVENVVFFFLGARKASLCWNRCSMMTVLHVFAQHDTLYGYSVGVQPQNVNHIRL